LKTAQAQVVGSERKKKPEKKGLSRIMFCLVLSSVRHSGVQDFLDIEDIDKYEGLTRSRSTPLSFEA
jgi:hypothetical protein